MTLAGYIVSLFPLFIFSFTTIVLVLSIFYRSAALLVLAPIILYAIPVICYRIHCYFYPLKDGIYNLSSRKYIPWWASYQFQRIFINWPSLEAVFHLIPGGYSLWLRLWGSKIGKSVYWSPSTLIVDRGLIEIGDEVVVGYQTVFCSHAIMPIRERQRLIIRRIQIGAGAFIGGYSGFGPGAKVESGESLRAFSRRYYNGEYKDESNPNSMSTGRNHPNSPSMQSQIPPRDRPPRPEL